MTPESCWLYRQFRGGYWHRSETCGWYQVDRGAWAYHKAVWYPLVIESEDNTDGVGELRFMSGICMAVVVLAFVYFVYL